VSHLFSGEWVSCCMWHWDVDRRRRRWCCKFWRVSVGQQTSSYRVSKTGVQWTFETELLMLAVECILEAPLPVDSRSVDFTCTLVVFNWEEKREKWFIAYNSSMLDCTWNIKTLKQEHTIQNHNTPVTHNIQ